MSVTDERADLDRLSLSRWVCCLLSEAARAEMLGELPIRESVGETTDAFDALLALLGGVTPSRDLELLSLAIASC